MGESSHWEVGLVALRPLALRPIRCVGLVALRLLALGLAALRLLGLAAAAVRPVALAAAPRANLRERQRESHWET